jgi:hypothetical protein
MFIHTHTHTHTHAKYHPNMQCTSEESNSGKEEREPFFKKKKKLNKISLKSTKGTTQVHIMYTRETPR